MHVDLMPVELTIMRSLLFLLVLTAISASPFAAVEGTNARASAADLGPLQWLHSILGPSAADPYDYSNNFGPNLTACHPSFSDAGAPVYCCPPIPDSTQEIIDFELPDLSSAPVRLRRATHLVTDESYISKYERAVAIMKSLPPEHPHNFRRQANMHCIYCTGAYDQVHSSHLFKIHRSWFFFPWHRAFIFFYERIIGKLIGDDSFALPYWQWDHPLGMMIPDMYMVGALDHDQRDYTHLPPTVTDNNYKRFERGRPPAEQIDANLAFMYHQMVSGASKPELFMGCKLRAGEEDMCNGPGTIESAPHNTLHAWVGSGFNPEREDMGAFYAAARDPVFYSHHANIDRLWLFWKELHGNKPEITDPLWLNTSFYFYNENLQLVRVKVHQFLDITKLGYRYETADMPWINKKPKPTVDPKVAHKILEQRKLNTTAASLAMVGSSAHAPQPVYFGPQGRALDNNITVEVPRTPKKQQQLLQHRKLKQSTEGRDDDDEAEEVLVVYGIETSKDEYTKFDVYVNMVDEEATVAAGPLAREFAGTFVAMRRGVRVVREEGFSGEGVKTVLKLGISELLRELEAEEDESIWVTLVPEGPNISVEGVRIEYMKWE